MATISIRPFRTEDTDAVINLWFRCGLVRPTNDPRKDIARKLKVRPDLFILGWLEGELVASSMVGYEGHRGWVNYFGVSPDCRRKGFGRAMMAEVQRLLAVEGCPKINLQVLMSNESGLEFYKALGFVQDPIVSLGKRLECDEPAGEAPA